MKTILLLCALCLPAVAGEVSTNLSAVVSTVVSTNIVSGDNASGCSICSGSRLGHFNGAAINTPAVWPPANCQPFKAATERWTTSNVVQTVTVTVEWNGKKLAHSDQTELSSVTERWKLTQDWKKE